MRLAGYDLYDDESTRVGLCKGSRLAINRANAYGREIENHLENAIKLRDSLKSARDSKEVKAYKEILLSLDIELARAKRDLKLSIQRAERVNLKISDLVQPTSLAGWFDCNNEQKRLRDTLNYIIDLAVQRGNVEGQIAFYKMLSKEGLIELKRLIYESKQELAKTKATNELIKKRLAKYYTELDKDKLIDRKQEKQKVNIQALKEKDNMILMGSLTVLGILLFVKKINN